MVATIDDKGYICLLVNFARDPATANLPAGKAALRNTALERDSH